MHLLAVDVALFNWTNNNTGDLILTNNSENQLVHEQHMLRHTMKENPIKDAIEKVNISLSSLTLTLTQILTKFNTIIVLNIYYII